MNRPSAGMLFLVGDEIIFFLDLELRFNLDNRGADTDSRAVRKMACDCATGKLDGHSDRRGLMAPVAEKEWEHGHAY